MLNKKKTLWSHDLDMFAGEDAMRWSFGGGGKAPAPAPPPPADKANDGRPDDAKSKGIAAAAKTRSSQRSQGSRGGLKIGLTGGSKKSSGLNVPSVGQTAERSY
jgi:hypothetical protein